jgi:arylsulfatase A-like enzyme
MPVRPNVLWITTHDINPHLACYDGVWPGAGYAVSPHLDRLASEGARYDNAFVTAPVCSPSRSSVITGCYPTAIGTMHHRTSAVPPPEVRLLPEYFRAAGYYTTNNFLTDYQVMVPPTALDECSRTAHWRNRPTPGTPFFATFHGYITHESQIYVDDEQFAASTRHVADEHRHDPARAPLPPYYPDTPVFRRAWARYSDLITEMDYSVGEILRQLADDGLAESTIVVFWSDHGLGMPRGKRWVNETGLRVPLIVRWPGKIAPGTVRCELVSLMDLAPTMLKMCGLPVPGHMHGVPVIDAGGVMPDTPHEYVFGARDRMDEQEDNSRTVRDSRYRYIHHLHPDRSPMQYCSYPDHLATWQELRELYRAEADQLANGEPRDKLTPLQRSLITAAKPEHELYDLLADPHEETNLADDPKYGDVVGRLSAALAAWRESVGDLGDAPEDELVEAWRPGGKRQLTERPRVQCTEGRVTADCATPGSSIGWTTIQAAEAGQDLRLGKWARAVGFADDGRRWQIYTGPLEAPAGTRLYLRAWRLGFDPSEEVAVDI